MSKKRDRNVFVVVTIILVLAVTGLVIIDIDPVSADRVVPTGERQKVEAEGSGTSQSSSGFAPATPVWSMLKMISALVVVIILVYLGLYLLKRLMSSRQRRSGRKALLEVIQSTYVGPKKTVSLIRVADRSVLVGVTDAQISILTEMDADETAVILAGESEKEEPGSFARLLGGASSRLRQLGLQRDPAAQEG
ncbi:MAG: flagellar biosynthetic protein FliO [Candidatus Zixiibacteriota bacterium]|nr:MAG: flagellar biosynthetic protein FliO [candidate division Zixibacteria bacterium]